jgi:EmrB/QacA subfamily drug resistance transporter
MAFIDSTALNVILPSLQKDLNASGTDLFWMLNSYLLMLASLIILGGSLGDKLGRVKVFKFGILVFTLGSILCGFAMDELQLIIFRGIQGIGGAFMIPGSLSIISSVFTPEEKGKAIGTWSAATTVVTVCGPVLGGALADLGLWRAIFFINVPLGIASYVILHMKVPETKEPGSSKIDWLGASVLTFSLLALTYGFLGMPEWGYTHPMVIGTLLMGTLALIAFILIENNKEDPMIPLSIFKNTTFSGVNFLSFLLYAALGAMMLFLSLNIIQIQGYSQLQAGLTFLPFSFLMITIARRMGVLTDKYGARPFLIMGPIVTGTGMLLLSFIGLTKGPTTYWFTFFPPFLVFAFGMAMTVVPLTTAVMNAVDVSKSGIASGINNSITRISGTFMNAFLGAFAILFFVSAVDRSIAEIPVSSADKALILSEAANFGEASLREGLITNSTDTINRIYDASFIQTYRGVGLISAVMAYLSAIFAFFMVKKKSEF